MEAKEYEKRLKALNMKDLKGACKAINGTGLLETNIKIVGPTKDALMKTFTSAVEALSEAAADIPAESVELYNTFWNEEDEPEDEPTTATEEATKEEAVEPAKKDTKKAAKKKDSGRQKPPPQPQKKSDLREFLHGMLAEGKHTRKEVREAAFLKFPQLAKSTTNTYLSDGGNPKYTKFEGIIVANEDGVLSLKPL